MHRELTTDPQRTEVWHHFIREFLPANPSFTHDDLLIGVTGLLRKHSEEHFVPRKPLNKVIVRKLLECYLERDALGDLQIITHHGGEYSSGSPQAFVPRWDAQHLHTDYIELSPT